MKLGKRDRHKKILEIINDIEISTQDELVEQLKEAGLNVTQATVSRDVKELNIVKANTANGKQKFVAMRSVSDPGTDKLLKIFSEAVVSSAHTGNLVIISTLPGMGQACASAIDAMQSNKIVGTIAGDDTVFVAVHEIFSVEEIEEQIMQFAKTGEYLG